MSRAPAKHGMRTRNKPLKTAFVVTFSTAAFANGCAGRTVEEGANINAPAVCSATNCNEVDAGDAGPKSACPAAVPSGACEGDAKCKYTETPQGCPPADVEVQCQHGSWKYLTVYACNPPANVCPSTIPISGSACGFANGFTCNYPNSSGPQCPDNSVVCQNGKWKMLVASCNPPPPTRDAGSSPTKETDASRASP